MCGSLTKTKLGITDKNNGEEPYASPLNRALLMAILRRAALEVRVIRIVMVLSILNM